VAEQFKPDEKVARVGWGRVGVGGYRFEPGDDAGTARLHVGIRFDISCCKDGGFIGGPCLNLGPRVGSTTRRTQKRARKARLSGVPNVRQVVDETDQK
jgi:hypothetical protein